MIFCTKFGIILIVIRTCLQNIILREKKKLSSFYINKHMGKLDTHIHSKLLITLNEIIMKKMTDSLGIY